MIIPYTDLSEGALESLIEDFVTRDGTDYGVVEMTREQKAEHLMTLLKAGEVLISYDQESQTCGLVLKQDV